MTAPPLPNGGAAFVQPQTKGDNHSSGEADVNQPSKRVEPLGSCPICGEDGLTLTVLDGIPEFACPSGCELTQEQQRESLLLARRVSPDDDDEPEPYTSRLLSAKQRRELPKPQWTIENLMPRWGIGQLFGPSGGGKTFVALDLALTLANVDPEFPGDEWYGRPVHRGGEVVYVAMEGGFDLQQRIDAWLLAHPGATDDRLYTLIEEEVSLADRRSVGLLLDDIEALFLEPVLIVIDTQALATPGTDENSNTDMGIVMSNLKAVAKGLRTFVMLVHHSGWSNQNRSRGASAQLAALDLAIGVNSQVISPTKVKAAPLGDPMRFVLEGSGESAWAKPDGDRSKQENRVLRLLLDAEDVGATADELATLMGVSEKSVRRYLGDLVDGDLVQKIPGARGGTAGGRTPDRYVRHPKTAFLASWSQTAP
jgi:hypothetical protein